MIVSLQFILIQPAVTCECAQKTNTNKLISSVKCGIINKMRLHYQPLNRQNAHKIWRIVFVPKGWAQLWPHLFIIIDSCFLYVCVYAQLTQRCAIRRENSSIEQTYHYNIVRHFLFIGCCSFSFWILIWFSAHTNIHGFLFGKFKIQTTFSLPPVIAFVLSFYIKQMQTKNRHIHTHTHTSCTMAKVSEYKWLWDHNSCCNT